MNRLLIACGTAAALLVAAAPAAASDARVADGVLRVTAATGEANGVLVMPGDGGGLAVSDLGGTLSPGPGCAEGADGLTCTGARSIAIVLGDGEDTATVDSEVGLATTIDAGTSADYVVGGGGDDVIAARDGGPDTIACGDGQDTVTADPQDEVDRDCERVSRAEPPATTGGGFDEPAGDPGAGGDPASGGGSPDSSGSAPAGGDRTRSRLGNAHCASRGSGRSVVCSVRMSDSTLTGVVDMQVRSGSVVFAAGRGRIAHGVARVRLRSRLRMVGGRYALRVAVRAADRHQPVTRSFSVAVLGGAPV